LTDNRKQTIRSGAISGRHGLHLGHGQPDQRGTRPVIVGHLTDLAGSGATGGDLHLIRRDGQDEAIASAPLGRIETQPGQLTILGFHPQICAR
jgi:hypothetical protein